MFNARVTLVDTINRALYTYNTNEGWVVKKMKLEYANRIATILPIIYQKDKVQYFNDKSTMMISKANHGKSINRATIIYFQLVVELMKWEKCQKNMIEGTIKKEPKKDVYHFAIVLKVLFQKWFPLEKAKLLEKKEQAEQRLEEKRKRNSLRQRFITNKIPLNHTHISSKKEKQL